MHSITLSLAGSITEMEVHCPITIGDHRRVPGRAHYPPAGQVDGVHEEERFSTAQPDLESDRLSHSQQYCTSPRESNYITTADTATQNTTALAKCVKCSDSFSKLGDFNKHTKNTIHHSSVMTATKPFDTGKTSGVTAILSTRRQLNCLRYHFAVSMDASTPLREVMVPPEVTI